jgi:excisionase family DNA binding protein
MRRGRLLTVRQAGEESGLGERYVRRLVSEGRIPVYRWPNKVRVSEADLEAFVEQARQEPVPSPATAPRTLRRCS